MEHKVYRVELSRLVIKQLKKCPGYIVDKLWLWVSDTEKRGIYKVRQTPGYHDEPLKGRNRGQRSIRLSKSWRAIYRQRKSGRVEIILVEAVSKHDY